MAPTVAVTGNVPGSRPAAASDGPAIMPIDRGGGAPIEITRFLALRGAIATLPVNDRLALSSTRNSNVSASSPGFSTGMRSLIVRDQSQAPACGLKITAGSSVAANKTRRISPSCDSTVACDVSTIISSASAVAISNERAIANEQTKPFSVAAPRRAHARTAHVARGGATAGRFRKPGRIQLSFITNFGTGRVYPQFLDERNFIRLIGRSAEPIQINLLVICIVIIGIDDADQKQFERLMHIYT